MRYTFTVLLLLIILCACIILIRQFSMRPRRREQDNLSCDPIPEAETTSVSSKPAPVTHNAHTLEAKPIAGENNCQKELEFRYKKTYEESVDMDYTIHRADEDAELGKLLELELAKIKRVNQYLRDTAGKKLHNQNQK